jgi:hypothetical protein
MSPDEERATILKDALFACTRHPECKALADEVLRILGTVGWTLEYDVVLARKHFDRTVKETPIGLPDPSVVVSPPERL